MGKKNQIISTPKSEREMLAMTAGIVYLESAVRNLLHRHKEISLTDIAHNFLDEVEKIKDCKTF